MYKTSVQMFFLSLPDEEVLTVLDAQEQSPCCLENIVQGLDKKNSTLPYLFDKVQGEDDNHARPSHPWVPDMLPAGSMKPVFDQFEGNQVAEVDRHPHRKEELENEGDQDCGHVARLLEEYL